MQGLTIRTVALALAGVSLTGLAAPMLASAQAQNAAQREFNIPAQDMARALEAFGRQSGRDVLFDRGQVVGLRSTAVIGRLDPGDALRQLVGRAGLNISAPNAGTFVVGSRRAETPAGADVGDQGGVAEILVRGVRYPTLNVDIRRTEDEIQPRVIFDREDITRSGAQNVEEFLRRRMTAVTSFVANSQAATGGNGNLSSIDLRGLGDDETLILIDGRRVAGLTNGAGVLQPDINGIPVSAIERIEVLPSSASGIYGGGATGGVVNIILRRDYSGVDLSVNYRNTFDGSASVVDLNASLGFSLFNGRTRVLANVSHTSAGRLLIGERDFGARRIQTILANNPSAILGAPTPPLGSTTNIRSATGANLTLRGTNIPLNSPITFVPVGYAGIASDGGAALVANAGQYNLELADTAQAGAAGASLLNAPEVDSLLGTIRHEVFDWLDAFAEVSVSRNAGSVVRNSASSTFSLPAGAASNPFNQAIIISLPGFGADQTTEVETYNYRVSTGLIFNLPGDWRGSIDYTWNRSRYASTTASLIDTAAATSAISNGLIDAFRTAPIDLSSFLLPNVRTAPVSSTLNTYALRAGGSLWFELPGGKPVLSLLLERREERFGEARSITPTSPASVFEIVTPWRSQSVNSAYAELLIPLAAQDGPLLDLLEIQLAARWDEYATDAANTVVFVNGTSTTPFARARNSFQSVNPTAGLRWRPVRGLMLRGSFSTGFLPPAVNRLVPGTPTLSPAILGFTDPLRGNLPIGDFFYVPGGDPSLRPERSESWSAGVVLSPRFAPGLRMSVDWTRIEKVDAIASPGLSQSFLNDIILFVPDRVVRGPVPVGDPYGVGPIQTIRTGSINLGVAAIEALDIALDYELNLHRVGKFTLGIDATHLLASTQQITPSAPVTDIVGLPSSGGGLEWRLGGSLTWERGPWSASWSVRHFDSYRQSSFFIVSQGSDRVASQAYHDVFVSYRSERLNAEIRLGANNIFNTAPPVDVSLVETGYSPFGDPRLANYYIGLRKSF